MSFRFKQFSVEDSHSTMPVGTDSMLLGALTDPGNASRILDIGTGCGVLALMMAQKSRAIIDAVELDQESANEAAENFQMSPWNTRLACFPVALQLIELLADRRYDLIISNPPFFKNSLKPESIKKALARHDLTLSLEELMKDVATLLSKDGRFAFILPADRWPEAQTLAKKHQLFPMKLVRIFPYPGGKVTRIIAELSPVESEQIQESELTILNEERKYSAEYLAATKDFHYF
ncbi:MAG: methyltransferase [Bacteroidales bacterium]|nr:methyltransferase [Bacteroidales bacterium]